jgi:hypothetical protein
MGVGSDSGIARVRDVQSCREWFGTLPGDGAERLAAIGALLARLNRPGIDADPLFEILEQVRVEQVRTIERLLAPLEARPVPYAEAQWHLVAAALANLRASRDLFKRTYSQMLRSDGGDAHSIIPGAANALRVVMPLARALDAQARMVALLLRHRTVPLAADWDALCVLARHMRRTTFQDETLLDEVPMVKPVTGRALFVYPLLLRAAALPRRSMAEGKFADGLASRVAAKVGFRIDHGEVDANPHGPTLRLTAEHSVRLDTHRLPDSLARRRQHWLAGGGERPRRGIPLTDGVLGALLDDLARCWTDPTVEPAPQPTAAPSATQSARVRFGLPHLHAADLRAGADNHRPAPAGGSNRYVYGRWEHNTIIRLALGAEGERHEPAALLMAEGETVSRLECRPGKRYVFERYGSAPRAVLGALLAIAAQDALSLGTIEAIEQLPQADYLRLCGHRLTVRCWDGVPVPAGVKIGDALSFTDAWLLPGDATTGQLPSLVLVPGRAHAGARAVLREPERDVPIRFASLVERGPGFERLSLRMESPHPPRGHP